MKNEADEEEENNNHNKRNPDWQKQTDSLIHEESIAESGRIFIRNLPFITTEEELQAIFEKYGIFFNIKNLIIILFYLYI
jgi:multiple RNA-binding domain-containing protein 1